MKLSRTFFILPFLFVLIQIGQADEFLVCPNHLTDWIPPQLVQDWTSRNGCIVENEELVNNDTYEGDVCRCLSDRNSLQNWNTQEVANEIKPRVDRILWQQVGEAYKGRIYDLFQRSLSQELNVQMGFLPKSVLGEANKCRISALQETVTEIMRDSDCPAGRRQERERLIFGEGGVNAFVEDFQNHLNEVVHGGVPLQHDDQNFCMGFKSFLRMKHPPRSSFQISHHARRYVESKSGQNPGPTLSEFSDYLDWDINLPSGILSPNFTFEYYLQMQGDNISPQRIAELRVQYEQLRHAASEFNNIQQDPMYDNILYPSEERLLQGEDQFLQQIISNPLSFHFDPDELRGSFLQLNDHCDIIFRPSTVRRMLCAEDPPVTIGMDYLTHNLGPAVTSAAAEEDSGLPNLGPQTNEYLAAMYMCEYEDNRFRSPTAGERFDITNVDGEQSLRDFAFNPVGRPISQLELTMEAASHGPSLYQRMNEEVCPLLNDCGPKGCTFGDLISSQTIQALTNQFAPNSPELQSYIRAILENPQYTEDPEEIFSTLIYHLRDPEKAEMLMTLVNAAKAQPQLQSYRSLNWTIQKAGEAGRGLLAAIGLADAPSSAEGQDQSAPVDRLASFNPMEEPLIGTSTRQGDPDEPVLGTYFLSGTPEVQSALEQSRQAPNYNPYARSSDGAVPSAVHNMAGTLMTPDFGTPSAPTAAVMDDAPPPTSGPPPQAESIIPQTPASLPVAVAPETPTQAPQSPSSGSLEERPSDPAPTRRRVNANPPALPNGGTGPGPTASLGPDTPSAPPPANGGTARRDPQVQDVLDQIDRVEGLPTSGPMGGAHIPQRQPSRSPFGSTRRARAISPAAGPTPQASLVADSFISPSSGGRRAISPSDQGGNPNGSFFPFGNELQSAVTAANPGEQTVSDSSSEGAARAPSSVDANGGALPGGGDSSGSPEKEETSEEDEKKDEVAKILEEYEKGKKGSDKKKDKKDKEKEKRLTLLKYDLKTAYKFGIILPHEMIKELGVTNLVYALKLEGKTFYTFETSKEEVGLTIREFAYNPKGIPYKALYSTSEITRREKLLQLIDQLRDLDGTNLDLYKMASKTLMVAQVELVDEQEIEQVKTDIFQKDTHAEILEAIKNLEIPKAL